MSSPTYYSFDCKNTKRSSKRGGKARQNYVGTTLSRPCVMSDHENNLFMFPHCNPIT